MSKGLADTSVFVASEARRPFGRLPDLMAVSVITVAELQLGVLRARDAATRAVRLATLARVRRELPVVPVTEIVAEEFAALAAEMRESGLRPRVHDTWIAATALVLDASVCTQDDDFDAIPRVDVLKV